MDEVVYIFNPFTGNFDAITPANALINLDGGSPTSVYGGVSPIDSGGP